MLLALKYKVERGFWQLSICVWKFSVRTANIVAMIKTRFAPSPTGYLHVGGLRTALYNYMFAKKMGGNFILRIEDTDQTRYVEGAVENLINTLTWCGLSWDEGPYVQSERFDIYKEHAQKLLESGDAYYCFCTKERLLEMKKGQEESHTATMYDRHCLHLSKEEIQKNLSEKKPYVIRQKIPYEILKFKDLIRGKVQFDGRQVDDQVLIKSDGFPTYHLANVIDDHLMGITHVIRGEEWLPSTPKHIWLYKAFGWEPPEFSHIPLLLNADRSKLSKRQGHVSVEEYINDGVDKDALINFIAFLGWHPGGHEENEIFSIQELIEKFSLEKVHKAGAIFDLDKLAWYSWQWRKKKISAKTEGKTKDEKIDELLSLCVKYIPEEWQKDKNYLRRCIITVEEKILRNPKEVKEAIEFYFNEKDATKELLLNEKMKVTEEIAQKSLKMAKEKLEKIDDFSETNIQQTLLGIVEELKVKNGQVLWPFRAALTGEEFSPGAFEVAYALGKEKVIKKLEKTLALLA